MPVLHLMNAGPLSSEQKKALAEKLTADIAEITGKPPASVYLRIDEVPRTDFSVGGVILSEKDKLQGS